MKIILDIEDGISEEEAIRKVQIVVQSGRISVAKGVQHYCWLTQFPDQTQVLTRRKKKGQTSDSFVVRKNK